MSAPTEERVKAAMARVADLWPEHLEAVPGSYEVAMKRDADTLRGLARFWADAQEPGAAVERTQEVTNAE